MQRVAVVRRVTESAIETYKFFAEQGDINLQYRLGRCYEFGNGVTQNDDKAFEWYKKSAEQGESRAEYRLGRCYENGQGVAKDVDKAFEWYKKKSAEVCED